MPTEATRLLGMVRQLTDEVIPLAGPEGRSYVLVPSGALRDLEAFHAVNVADEIAAGVKARDEAAAAKLARAEELKAQRATDPLESATGRRATREELGAEVDNALRAEGVGSAEESLDLQTVVKARLAAEMTPGRGYRMVNAPSLPDGTQIHVGGATAVIETAADELGTQRVIRIGDDVMVLDGDLLEVPAEKIDLPTAGTTRGSRQLPPEVASGAPDMRLEPNSLPYIEQKHGDEIRNHGYKTVEDFINDVLDNFTHVYRGKNDTLILAKKNGKAELAFIELVPDENRGYWRVNNAFPARADYLQKKPLLWERAQSSQSAADGPPSAISGQSKGSTIFGAPDGQVKQPRFTFTDLADQLDEVDAQVAAKAAEISDIQRGIKLADEVNRRWRPELIARNEHDFTQRLVENFRRHFVFPAPSSLSKVLLRATDMPPTANRVQQECGGGSGGWG